MAPDSRTGPGRKDSAVRLASRDDAEQAPTPRARTTSHPVVSGEPPDRAVVPFPRPGPGTVGPTDGTGRAPRTDGVEAAPEGDSRRSLRSLGEALGLARRAAEMAESVASTEEEIAATLRSLARGPEDVVRRRLALAEEATRGVQEARRRGVRLRRLTDRTADRLRRAELLGLTRRAESELVRYARTEERIASALRDSGAPPHPPVAGTDRDPRRATAAARAARGRAAALHRLAEHLHEAPRRAP